MYSKIKHTEHAKVDRYECFILHFAGTFAVSIKTVVIVYEEYASVYHFCVPLSIEVEHAT